jgi:hypothetical protein
MKMRRRGVEDDRRPTTDRRPQTADGRRRNSQFAIRNSLLTLLALFFLTAAPLAAQDDEPLSLTAYREEVAAVRAALLEDGDLNAAAATLAEIDAVRLETGEILEIDPLLAEVEDQQAALARLETALAQIDAAANDQVEDRLRTLQSVRDRLALDRPTIWQRIWRWIEDLLDALMPDRVPQGATNAADLGSRLLVWTIVIVGGLLLAILLSYWLRSLLGGILADQLLNRSNDDKIPQSAAEARTQAQQLAEVGNFRGAVRQLYLAALLHLDEQGILRFHRDQTNREVLAQTEDGSSVREHLTPVVDTFDRVWYGVREPDQQTFEVYRREIDDLMAESEDRKRG